MPWAGVSLRTTWHCSACRLVVAEGGEDVTIKVSDEGGGIPRSGMSRIWTYLYSTAKQPVDVDQVGDGKPVRCNGFDHGWCTQGLGALQ